MLNMLRLKKLYEGEGNVGWLPAWDGWEAKYVIGMVGKYKYIKVFPYCDDKVSNFMYIKSKELAEKLYEKSTKQSL